MKKIYCIVCMFLPMVASADALDDKIARLTQEKLDKLAKLEQCQKSTKGLKIAGWTTLGISAIGIGANIGEAVALNKLDTKIGNAQEQSEKLDGQINAIQQQKREQEIEQNKSGIEQNKSGNVIPDCGEQNKCGDLTAAQLLTNLNATELVCVNGVSKPTDCYSQGEPTGKKQCKNGNVVITYYDTCPGTSVKKTTRKNGDLCTDDESAKVLYAQETFWQNGKCVAKSCQDGKFLSVENGVSLGECVTACSSYQIIDWSAGGKACDTSLQFNPTKNCDRKVFSRAEYTKNMCYGKCQGYAHENNCKLTGDPIENQQTGECICNPVQLDWKTTGGVVELPACQEQEVEKNSKSECDAYCAQYADGKKCELTRGNVYYSDTKQCFCNAAAPRKREKGQSLYDKMVAVSNKIEEAAANSDVPAEASILQQTVKKNKEKNDKFLKNTEEMVNANKDGYGNAPVWDLVGGAVPSVPKKQQPVQSNDVKKACAEKVIMQANAHKCDALCEKYAEENDCYISKSGSVTTTNMVACYCNPSATVTLDGANKRVGGFGAAAGVIGGL